MPDGAGPAGSHGARLGVAVSGVCPAVPGAPARCRWGRRAATGPAGPCLWGRLETVHVVSLSELRNDADVSASGASAGPGRGGAGWSRFQTLLLPRPPTPQPVWLPAQGPPPHELRNLGD